MPSFVLIINGKWSFYKNQGTKNTRLAAGILKREKYGEIGAEIEAGG